MKRSEAIKEVPESEDGLSDCKPRLPRTYTIWCSRGDLYEIWERWLTVTRHQTARNLNILCGVIILYMLTGADVSSMSVFGMRSDNLEYAQPITWAVVVLFCWFCYRHNIAAPIRLYIYGFRTWGEKVPWTLGETCGLPRPVQAADDTFRVLEITQLDANNYVIKYEFKYLDRTTTKETILKSPATAEAVKEINAYLSTGGFFFRSEYTADYVVPWIMSIAVVVLAVIDHFWPLTGVAEWFVWGEATSLHHLRGDQLSFTWL